MSEAPFRVRPRPRGHRSIVPATAAGGAGRVLFAPPAPAVLIATAALLASSAGAAAQGLSFADVQKLKAAAPVARIAYGSGPQQFGELWVPRGQGPHPVAVVVHGGCWQKEYGEDHVRPLCAAIADMGIAAWCLEYRRVGDAGGGWPGTLEDVGRGADQVRRIAATYALDVRRAIAVGHSAGGQLALWLGARPRLPESDPRRGQDPLRFRGVVGLAAITDLARGAAAHVCGTAVEDFLGGSPAAQPARYAAASPFALLPLGVRQELVHGRADRIVPVALSADYAAAARAKGEAATFWPVDGAGHFDVIAPGTTAWRTVEKAVRSALE
jgi:acetyl esterase/lipase